MPKIFMSYRGADSETVAGRIYDHLIREFGQENVFKGTSLIRPGDDFRGKIRESVAQCDVLLVVIGKKWLNISKSKQSESRLLDDPEDWVRIEVESGLQRSGVRVIPILVQGASMPSADELPPTLRELAFKNKIDIHEDPLFQSDMIRLVDALGGDVPKEDQTKGVLAPQKKPMSTEVKVALIGLAGVIVAALISILPNLINQPQTAATASPTAVVTSTSTQSSTATPLVNPSSTVASVSGTSTNNTAQTPVATQIVAPSTVDTPPSGNVQLSLIASENSLVLYVPQSANLTGFQLTAFISNIATPFLLTDYIEGLKLASGVAQTDSCYVLALEGTSDRLPLACRTAVDGGRVFKQFLSESDRFWYDGLRNSQRDLVIYKDGKSTGIACPASQPTCKFEWEF